LKYSDPSAKAWQRQIRDSYEHYGSPVADPILKTARVKRVARTTAERIILMYEWLGTMGASGLYYGIYFGPYCAGVTCVAPNGAGAAAVNAGGDYGVTQREMAFLVRGACVHWAPPGSNSKLVSWTVRFVREDAPTNKILMAYADPDAGEIGTIYQACNWTYIGNTGEARNQIRSPSGTLFHLKTVWDWAKQRKVKYTDLLGTLKREGWVVATSSGKGKYAVALHGSMTPVLSSLSLPYPKRVKPSIEVTDDQSGEAGEIPSRALQSNEATR